jgi:phosphoribosyl 1,2-cyclic phosphodiesterase
MTVDVTFWGVRGSLPCPTPDHLAFGGNTSCVTVEAAGQIIILDAGTGIFALGKDMMRRGVTSATLLLSHAHIDHILGFPFFGPVWSGDFSLTVMAGNLTPTGGVRRVFDQVLGDPLFPVPVQAMSGVTSFHDFAAGTTFMLGPDVLVKTIPLNHPNGASAYRIESGGRAVCYVTDVEHEAGTLDQDILAFIKDCDLLIYDSTYSDEEYVKKVGWGHSTWQQGVRLSKAANVKRYAVFHHDPDHTDDIMREVEASVTNLWRNAFVAREGMIIRL